MDRRLARNRERWPPHPFGDEGAVFTELELVINNDTDEPIYIAVAAARPER